jgi:hypothetical protein
MQHLFLLSYQFHLIFVTVIAIEAFFVWQSGRKYSLPETICSFWMNIGQIIINKTLIKIYHLTLLTWAWHHRWCLSAWNFAITGSTVRLIGCAGFGQLMPLTIQFGTSIYQLPTDWVGRAGFLVTFSSLCPYVGWDFRRWS